jgi:hypothetical protein
MTVGFESASLHLEVVGGSTSHRPPRCRSCAREQGVEKKKEKGKQRREGSGPRPSAVRRSLDLAVAGGSPGRSLWPPPPVCCERCGGEWKGLGFAAAGGGGGGCPCCRFWPREKHGGSSDHRSAVMDGCELPGANGPPFGPGGKTEQAVPAACPLVAGPRAQRTRGDRTVGCILSRAGKERCCTICFVNCFDDFRSIYVWFFDELCIVLIPTQIEPTRYLCRDWNVIECFWIVCFFMNFIHVFHCKSLNCCSF